MSLYGIEKRNTIEYCVKGELNDTKFKYYVTLAYLDTSEDDVKFEYIENQAYNAKDAVALAKSYMSQFGNVQGLTVIEVSRK